MPTTRSHHIEVMLKPSDRASACPQEDRCQLELVKNDYPEVLTVTVDPLSLNRSVRVGLLAATGGCDYECRVGLVPHQSGDFILITETKEVSPYTATVTIFDVNANQVLDLAIFVPRAGSPAAPASLPCTKNTAFNAWWDYNFSSPAVPMVVPYTVSGFTRFTGTTDLDEVYSVNTDHDCQFTKNTFSVSNPNRRMEEEYYYHAYYPAAGFTWNYSLVLEDGATYTGMTLTDGVVGESRTIYTQYRYTYSFDLVSYVTATEVAVTSSLPGLLAASSRVERSGSLDLDEMQWGGDYIYMPGGGVTSMPNLSLAVAGLPAAGGGGSSFALLAVRSARVGIAPQAALNSLGNVPYIQSTPCNVITTPDGTRLGDDIVYQRPHCVAGFVSLLDAYTGPVSVSGEYSIISLSQSADSARSAGLVLATEALISHVQSAYGLSYIVANLSLAARVRMP